MSICMCLCGSLHRFFCVYINIRLHVSSLVHAYTCACLYGCVLEGDCLHACIQMWDYEVCDLEPPIHYMNYMNQWGTCTHTCTHVYKCMYILFMCMCIYAHEPFMSLYICVCVSVCSCLPAWLESPGLIISTNISDRIILTVSSIPAGRSLQYEVLGNID